MITAGTIKNTSQHIVTTGNSDQQLSYDITISLFDYGGDKRTHTIKASSASSPGICGGYAEGDVVIVGFFQNDFDQAVILGKIDKHNANLAAACAVRTNKLVLTNGSDNIQFLYEDFAKLRQLLNNTAFGPSLS